MTDKKDYRRNKKINKSNIRNGQKNKMSLQDFNDDFVSSYQLSSGDFDRHKLKEELHDNLLNEVSEKDLEEKDLEEKDLEKKDLEEKDLEFEEDDKDYEKYDDGYFEPVPYKK